MYAANECEPEATEAELVAQDADREGRDDAAAEARLPVLEHVREVAYVYGVDMTGTMAIDEHEISDSFVEETINGVGIDYLVRRVCGLNAEGIDSTLAWDAVRDVFCERFLEGLRAGVAGETIAPDGTS